MRQKRERARDLDGIDAKNIVEGRPRRDAVAMAADAPQNIAYGGTGGVADDARDAASSPPDARRRRVLRIDEWDDDDK